MNLLKRMNLFKQNRLLLVLIIAGALSATACSNMRSAADAAGPDDKKAGHPQIVASGDTDTRLDIVNVVTAQTGDTSRAGVEVKNDSRFAYSFEYRFKWYDVAGMEINPDSTPWTPVSIMANESKSLQSLAPNPAGKTFKLFLQEK